MQQHSINKTRNMKIYKSRLTELFVKNREWTRNQNIPYLEDEPVLLLDGCGVLLVVVEGFCQKAVQRFPHYWNDAMQNSRDIMHVRVGVVHLTPTHKKKTVI